VKLGMTSAAILLQVLAMLPQRQPDVTGNRISS
jgi:hypothetical protein